MKRYDVNENSTEIIDVYAESLTTPLGFLCDENLPENIEEIEKIVGEAYLNGDIDIYKNPQTNKTVEKLKYLLRDKNVMPVPTWGFTDLAAKICHRLYLNISSYDFGLNRQRQEYLETYQRIKERPSVKKLVDDYGLQDSVLLVIKHIDVIDKEFDKGKTFSDIYNSVVYNDYAISNYAFLNYIEDHFSVEIKNQKHLLELAQITTPTYIEFIEDLEEEDSMSKEEFIETTEGINCCYFMALSCKYSLTLGKVLKDGGEYKDLLDVDYESFGFPIGPQLDTGKAWRLPNSPVYFLRGAKQKSNFVKDTSQKGFIREAIFYYFNLGEPDFFRRLSIRDLANSIKAPYGEVLKASRIFD